MTAGDDIAGCILAGGQSRRMGEDKARRRLAGVPLIALAIARLKPQVATLVVNRHDETVPVDTQGLPVVTDAPGAHQGPLAGIFAALDWARRNNIAWVATVAVGTPFFPRDLVRKLAEAAQGRDMAVASSDGRLHPVFGFWKTTLAAKLGQHIGASPRSALDWAVANNAGIADWPAQPYDPFFNINTPEDASAALAIAAEFRP